MLDDGTNCGPARIPGISKTSLCSIKTGTVAVDGEALSSQIHQFPLYINIFAVIIIF